MNDTDEEVFPDDRQRYRVTITVTPLNSEFYKTESSWNFVVNTESATREWTSKVSSAIEQELLEYFYDKRLN